MHIQFTIRTVMCLLVFALLVGCHRDEQSYVERTVTAVGSSNLINEAVKLAAEHSEKEGFPVDPTVLPPSFRAFAPVETWRYDQSFFIVTARNLQHRVGVWVQPLDHPVPPNSPTATYTRIEDGVYFVSS